MKDYLPLILFDPDCPLCLRFKQGVEFLDKNIRFESVHSDDVYLEFPELDKNIDVFIADLTQKGLI